MADRIDDLEREFAAVRNADGPLRTGAEVVAFWEREGLIGTRPDIVDPAAHARALRARATVRRRRGPR